MMISMAIWCSQSCNKKRLTLHLLEGLDVKKQL